MRPFQRSQAALLVCCALAPLPARAEERLLAVLEFKSKLDGAESKTVDVGYLADVVRSAALEDQPGLRVMTRENMLVLVQASGKALADCEGECEVDTGRKLGADLVVSGELLKFGTKYKLDLRLHDTKEGRLLSGAQASGKSVDELDDATGAAVKKLLAVLRPAAPVATPAPALAAPSVPAPAPAPAPANPRDGVAAASAPAPAAAPGAFSPAAVSASEAQLVQRAFAASFSNTTASLMRDKCQKDAKDCAMFAFGYANGSWDMEQDGPTALAVYQHGCSAGDFNSCQMAINALWQGTNVKKDVPRAQALARQSCSSGSAGACFLLQMIGTSDDKVLEMNQLRRLCLGGDVDGCHYALSGDFKSPEAQPLISEMRQLCTENKGNACFYIKTYREQGNLP